MRQRAGLKVRLNQALFSCLASCRDPRIHHDLVSHLFLVMLEWIKDVMVPRIGEAGDGGNKTAIILLSAIQTLI